MLIAVTGATGFVGGRVVAGLADRGHSVLAYGRRPMSAAHSTVTYRVWDLLTGALQSPPGVDAVVHCAARVSDWGPAQAYLDANVDGTRSVLATFRASPRFVFVSSASVYDPHRPKHLLTEDAPYAQHYLNAYARSKMLAECVVRDCRRRAAVILRPHAVYGPGDRTLLPRLLAARRFGWLMAVGTGRNHLSLTHVDNLVHAVVCAVEGATDEGTFNVADAVSATLDEVLRTLLQRLGLPARVAYLPTALAAPLASALEHAYRLANTREAPLLTPYIVSQLAGEYTLDISRAQRLLGYAPTITFRTGPLTERMV